MTTRKVDSYMANDRWTFYVWRATEHVMLKMEGPYGLDWDVGIPIEVAEKLGEGIKERCEAIKNDSTAIRLSLKALAKGWTGGSFNRDVDDTSGKWKPREPENPKD